MLSDPLVFPFASAITAGADNTFNRVADGKYIHAATTLSEPAYFTVQNTIDADGVSSFVFKYAVSKNVPGTVAYGAKPLPDDVSSVHMVVRWAHRAHDAAFMAAIRNGVVGFAMNSTLWDKALRGEI